MNIKIDKSDWVKVCLGDVAFEYSKRINNPSESEYDRFVGSSNIGQWDFRVKSWESTSSVTSAMKLFEPNDYLLVRRSLYASDFRERAPRAHFHGVCSGDILTIKENPKHIHDGFLIGVLNSPDLWKYVVANGSGSITRRIHWKDLANYEFLLPPKNQQEQIAELLWAGDENLKRAVKLVKAIITFSDVQREALVVNSATNWLKLSDIVKQKISYGIVQAGPHVEGGMPYIKSSDLTNKGIVVTNLQRTSSSIAEKYKRSEVNPGDIVFSLRGNLGQMNIVPNDLAVANLTQGTARISVKPDYHNEYVKAALEISSVQRRINSLSKGSTFKEISLEALRSVEVPIPNTRKEQEVISNKIAMLFRTKTIAESKITHSESLQKSLINQIF